jgi:hypothetical protein
MLAFPESGKGTDPPTLSTNLLEHTGQCCFLCRYCHFSIPVTAQGDLIRPPPHNTHVGKLCAKGWVDEGTWIVGRYVLRPYDKVPVMVFWYRYESSRTPVFLQIQNWFAVLNNVLNLIIGQAKYTEFKWRLSAALWTEAAALQSIQTDCGIHRAYSAVATWMKWLERESHYLASSLMVRWSCTSTPAAVMACSLVQGRMYHHHHHHHQRYWLLLAAFFNRWVAVGTTMVRGTETSHDDVTFNEIVCQLLVPSNDVITRDGEGAEIRRSVLDVAPLAFH